MNAEFRQFSFGGDSQLQMEGMSHSDVTNLMPDETGAACSVSGPEQKIRKRKIDKDGFVTPATPDIPKSSSHYGESSHNAIPDAMSASDGVDNGLSAEEESPSGLCLNPDLAEQNTEVQPCDLNTYPQQGRMLFKDTVRLEDKESNEPTCASSVQDLIKEIGQEAKLLHIQWAETFKESEDFEMLCPTRLDSYIEEAKRLESTLNSQKDVLFQRLHGLGKALQM